MHHTLSIREWDWCIYLRIKHSPFQLPSFVGNLKFIPLSRQNPEKNLGFVRGCQNGTQSVLNQEQMSHEKSPTFHEILVGQ